MASHLGRAEVERIAKLAHLTIAPDDAPRFAEQLSAILEYAESIQRVDTTGVPPLSGSASIAWREDAPARRCRVTSCSNRRLMPQPARDCSACQRFL
jgi:aspartyl/glutamyl-tRNA(Asn/Gln) amidotransferase C subunit